MQKSRDIEETVNELILNRTIKWQGQGSEVPVYSMLQARVTTTFYKCLPNLPSCVLQF